MDFFGNDNPFFNDYNIDNIDSFSDSHNLHQNSSFNADSDKPDKIHRRVKSIRQLKNIDKELVRLSYKEAVLRGLGNNITDIQDYILSKTHILVERTGMEYLKKSEENENRTWYSRLAKDSFLYIGTYKRAVDEIGQLKTEAWVIFMDSKTSQSEKIHTIRELHSLTKTYVLLLKDLPFVTNLSKYYDPDMLNSSYVYPLHSKGTISNKNDLDRGRNPIERKNIEKPENSGNPFEYNFIKEYTKEDNAPEENNCKSPNEHKQVDDKITATMQAQLNYKYNNGISKDHLEGIKRLKEIFED